MAGSRSEEMAEIGMLLERAEEVAAASAWMAAAVKAGREVYRSKARRHERSVREGEAGQPAVSRTAGPMMGSVRRVERVSAADPREAAGAMKAGSTSPIPPWVTARRNWRRVPEAAS